MGSHLSGRRHLLVLVLPLLLLLFGQPLAAAGATGPAGQSTTETTTSTVVDRWRFLMTGGEAYDPADPDIASAVHRVTEQAQRYWSTLDTSPGRTYLWSDAAADREDHTGQSAERLRTMAVAYATKGSPLHGDSDLRDDLVAALRWLYDNRYHEGRQETGNWWWWEIGIPDRLLDVLVLLGDAVPAQLRTDVLNAVASFLPDPTRRTSNGVEETGANRVDKAYITIRRGALAGDEAVIAQGRDALSQVFDYVSSGDGFYRDGSFVQHSYIAYTGSYGIVLIGSLVKALYVLDGSPWAVTDPDLANVYRWVFDSYEPVVFRSQVMSSVRGRAISRIGEDDHDAGAGLITHLALLAPTADPADRERIAAMLREWVVSDTYSDYFSGASVRAIVTVRDLIANAQRRGDLNLHQQYPAIDRVFHHRPGYVLGISARSDRIAAYESGNGENLRGWYTGEGMTSLYNSDLDQYSDGYWPTVDPYRLAGTTTATRATYPRSDTDRSWFTYRGPDRWVGGAALHHAGAYGMAFTGETDPKSSTTNTLTGKKSWFMVGDVVVALGADITATDGIAAQTTVENRMVPRDGATVTLDGRRRSTTGWDADLSGTRWAHLSGVGGYIFPDGGNLHGLGETRQGRWLDINRTAWAGADKTIAREYATIWFQHGQNPHQARYAYYVLPGATPEQTRAYSDGLADDGLRIGDNNASVQSVHGDGTLAANFWSCGSTLGSLSSSRPSSVFTQMRGGQLDVAVSDPTRSGDTVTVDIARGAASVVSADDNVRVTSLQPTIRLEVDTAGKAGRSSRASLVLDPSGRQPELPPTTCQG